MGKADQPRMEWADRETAWVNDGSLPTAYWDTVQGVDEPAEVAPVDAPRAALLLWADARPRRRTAYQQWLRRLVLGRSRRQEGKQLVQGVLEMARTIWEDPLTDYFADRQPDTLTGVGGDGGRNRTKTGVEAGFDGGDDSFLDWFRSYRRGKGNR